MNAGLGEYGYEQSRREYEASFMCQWKMPANVATAGKSHPYILKPWLSNWLYVQSTQTLNHDDMFAIC